MQKCQNLTVNSTRFSSFFSKSVLLVMQNKLVLRLLTLLLTGFSLSSQAQNALPLVPGMQILQNTVIQQGLYQFKADTALTKSLIRIQ